VQARIAVDKRQILPLRVGEGLCGATQTGHPIQPSIQASRGEEARMSTLSGRAEPRGARGTTGLLSGGKHSVRSLKRAQDPAGCRRGTSTSGDLHFIP
jgi:hypothetical protein